MDTHNLKYIISFLLLILFIGACSESVDTSGCPYPDSCNYNPDGTDEDSCWYPDGGCLCEDGEDAISDCAGECGGDSTVDCAGECGGSAVEDECGFCNGPGAILSEGDGINIYVDFTPQFSFDDIRDEAYIVHSANCIDDYDSFDIFQPPSFDSNWVKAYFNFPDWTHPFDGDGIENNFTKICNSLCKPKEFVFHVQSNTQGSLTILINIHDYFLFDSFGDILNGEIEVYDGDEMIDFYLDIENEVNINSEIQSNETKEFLIKLSFN